MTDAFAALDDDVRDSEVVTHRRRRGGKQAQQQVPQVPKRQPGRKPSKPVATLALRTKPKPGDIPGGKFRGEEVTFRDGTEEAVAAGSAALEEKHPRRSGKQQEPTTKFRKIKQETFAAELRAFFAQTTEDSRENALTQATRRLDEHFAAEKQDDDEVEDEDDVDDVNYPVMNVDAAMRMQLIQWMSDFPDDAVVAAAISLLQQQQHSATRMWLTHTAPRLMLHALCAAKPHVLAAVVARASGVTAAQIAWLTAQIAAGSTAIAAWLWLERVVPTASIGSGNEASATASGEFIVKSPRCHRSDSPPMNAASLVAALSRLRPADLPRPVSKLYTQLCTVELLLPAAGSDPSVLFGELLSKLQGSTQLCRAACDCLLAAPEQCFAVWATAQTSEALATQSAVLMQHVATLSAANIAKLGADRLAALAPAADSNLAQRLARLPEELASRASKQVAGSATTTKQETTATMPRRTSVWCKFTMAISALTAATIAAGCIWLHGNCCDVPFCAQAIVSHPEFASLLAHHC